MEINVDIDLDDFAYNVAFLEYDDIINFILKIDDQVADVDFTVDLFKRLKHVLLDCGVVL